MRFRPCIDLHNNQVKQIVGGTLDGSENPATNFVSEKAPEYYAKLYKQDGLAGGHIIKLGPGNDEAAMRALPVAEGVAQGPQVYDLTFDVVQPADTWLNLSGWGKGVVLLNGFTLGRFWHIGPQKRLYIPAPLLREGCNQLRILETEGVAGTVCLLDEPDLG